MKPPETDPTSIGNVIVSLGFITEEELNIAVKKFRASKEELLGEFLIRKTSLTEKQLKDALARQTELRKPTHATIVQAFNNARQTNDRLNAKTDELVELTTALAEKI